MLRVRVIPRSARCAVVGVLGGSLRVRLTAPPVEGKANAQCLRLLSEWLGCRPSQLEIRSGAGSREKRIVLRQVPPESLRRALEELTSPQPARPGHSGPPRENTPARKGAGTRQRENA